jgi:ABC-2 type transport system ATP-binding protein
LSVCVRAEHLSKRFHLLKSRRTAFGTIRALARGESLRREHWVLKDVTFDIDRGDKVALVGRNGSGKTTLLRIVSGIYRTTSGRLYIAESPRPLFSCIAGLRYEFSVVDNIYLFGALHGIARSRLEPMERSLLERIELSHLAYGPLKDVSVGQAQRLALAVFAETQSDFLILDEVAANTGNVDHGFRLELEKYFGAIARSEKTLLMTSHDASLLRRHCQKAIWLEAGELRRFGPVDDVVDEYEESFKCMTSPVGV